MPEDYLSANMNLPIPVTGVAPGPDWANFYNACLTIVDSHTHASGSGVPITPSAIQISANLPFLSNSATGLLSTQYISQGSPIAASTVRALYSAQVGGNSELFWNDTNSHQVQITTNGLINATSSGISSGSASASFSAGTLVVLSNVNTPGAVDGGSFIFRNIVANSKGCTVSPPAALAADYSLVLPPLPGSTLPVVLDSSGNLTTQTLTSAMLAANSVTATQVGTNANVINTVNITNGAVTTAKIASGAVGLAQLAAANEAFSSSFSVISTTDVFAAITGATVTLTCTGRNVVIEMLPFTSAGGPGSFIGFLTASGGDILFLELRRDASRIAIMEFEIGSSGTWYIPPASMRFVDIAPSVGPHTYDLFWSNATGSNQMSVQKCMMHAVEY